MTIGTYNGKPCRTEEMKVGDTLFTVISVESGKAKETAYEKVRKLIMGHTCGPGFEAR